MKSDASRATPPNDERLFLRDVVSKPFDAVTAMEFMALWGIANRAVALSEIGLRPAEGHCLLQVPQQTPETTSPCAMAGHCISVGTPCAGVQSANTSIQPSFVNMSVTYRGFIYGVGSEAGIRSLRRAIEERGDK